MPAAISTPYKTSIALAGAGVIAVSPLIPSQDTRITSVHLPEIQLTDLTVPAFGAIPYQIGINVVGDILAATPILVGSTQQCETYCLGPNTPAPDPIYAPFTGRSTIYADLTTGPGGNNPADPDGPAAGRGGLPPCQGDEADENRC